MELKETFDSAASSYELIRPRYSDEIAKEILSFFPKRPIKALEIGCGTGQATEMFVDQGVELICIDIGKNLLKIAQEKFRDKKNVQFHLSSFEEYEVSENIFDLIFAATSFHWIDPFIKFKKSAQLLKSDGILAVISQNPINTEQGFFSEVQRYYDSIAPELSLKVKAEGHQKQGEDTSPMLLIKVREYLWSQCYTADEYIKLLGTYSDHLILPDNQRKSLFKAIHNFITTEFSGSVQKDYLTCLHLYQEP